MIIESISIAIGLLNTFLIFFYIRKNSKTITNSSKIDILKQHIILLQKQIDFLSDQQESQLNRIESMEKIVSVMLSPGGYDDGMMN